MRINKNNCLFLMIDIQEKFMGKIQNLDNVVAVASTLNQASEIMDIPLIITEQYPHGLGKTISDIYIPENHVMFEKTKFSAMTEEVGEKIKTMGKKWLVLYGIETHVCLTQTALDALDMGLKVMFVTDGVSSRNSNDRDIALRRLERAGITLTTKEMLLFEIMKNAKNPSFRQISKLVK